MRRTRSPSHDDRSRQRRCHSPSTPALNLCRSAVCWCRPLLLLPLANAHSQQLPDAGYDVDSLTLVLSVPRLPAAGPAAVLIPSSLSFPPS